MFIINHLLHIHFFVCILLFMTDQMTALDLAGATVYGATLFFVRFGLKSLITNDRVDPFSLPDGQRAQAPEGGGWELGEGGGSRVWADAPELMQTHMEDGLKESKAFVEQSSCQRSCHSDLLVFNER